MDGKQTRSQWRRERRTRLEAHMPPKANDYNGRIDPNEKWREDDKEVPRNVHQRFEDICKLARSNLA